MSQGPHIIVCGSYEGSFVGWKYEPESGTLASKFSVSDHSQHVSSVSVCAKWMVTGSADENIRIYNAKKFVSVGSLVQHTDTVTCLRFSRGHQYLISGSRNGRVIVYRTKNWQPIPLKGHKKAVTDACIHSNNSLAITAGMDGCVITWNFLSGRTVDMMKFQSVPKGCSYSPKCTTFGVIFDKLLCIFSATERNEDAISKFTSESTIHCLHYVAEGIIALGREDKSILLVSCMDGTQICKVSEPHLSRVRGITCLNVVEDDKDGGKQESLVYSCDTSGRLCVWSFQQSKLVLPSASEGCIDTTIVSHKQKKRAKKRKRAAESEQENTLPSHVACPLQLVLSRDTELRLTCIDAYEAASLQAVARPSEADSD